MKFLMFNFKYFNSILCLLIGLIITIGLVILATVLLKNKDESKKMIPVQVSFYILVILEIIKIYYLISRDGGFNVNRFPIVFCSIVMYTYPMFCFKKNKLSDFAMGMSVIPCLISILFVFLIVGDYDMMQGGKFNIIHFHSVIYHLIMFGVSVYLITVKLYKFELRKFVGISLGLTSYVAMATILTVFIHGDISFFGYGFNGSPVFSFLYNKIGYFPGNFVVIILMWIVSFMIYGIIHLCTKHSKQELKEETSNVE
ncbi:MAG: hypothetical protein ACI311_07400 [Bacilli bacterium]